MYRIAISVFLGLSIFAGETVAHPGHGAPMVHSHGWEYVLLAAAIVVAAVGWFRARK
jgi:hypothetical protein